MCSEKTNTTNKIQGLYLTYTSKTKELSNNKHIWKNMPKEDSSYSFETVQKQIKRNRTLLNNSLDIKAKIKNMRKHYN